MKKDGILKFLPKITIVFSFALISCFGHDFTKTVNYVDIDKFMGDWFVIAGRFTSFEEGAHNALENYQFNKKENRIDIAFTFNKDSLTGKLTSIPQKAWIKDQKTNAYWSVSPFWPLYFDYLVVDLAEDYSWTAIGVPSQDYLWIMARDPHISKDLVDTIISRLDGLGYNTKNLVYVPHQ